MHSAEIVKNIYMLMWKYLFSKELGQDHTKDYLLLLPKIMMMKHEKSIRQLTMGDS